MQLTKPDLAAGTACAAKLQVNLDPAELKLAKGRAKPAGAYSHGGKGDKGRYASGY